VARGRVRKRQSPDVDVLRGLPDSEEERPCSGVMSGTRLDPSFGNLQLLAE
jgi:hypothetical protein